MAAEADDEYDEYDEYEAIDDELAGLTEQFDELFFVLPGRDGVEQALIEIQERARDEAEAEGRTEVSFTVEELGRRDFLLELLPLVTVPPDVENLGKEEIQRRVKLLHHWFWNPDTDRLREFNEAEDVYLAEWARSREYARTRDHR